MRGSLPIIGLWPYGDESCPEAFPKHELVTASSRVLLMPYFVFVRRTDEFEPNQLQERYQPRLGASVQHGRHLSDVSVAKESPRAQSFAHAKVLPGDSATVESQGPTLDEYNKHIIVTDTHHITAQR